MNADGLAPELREAIRLFWDSPFPATIQGPDFRLSDVNDAFVKLFGWTRERLIGIDPIELQPSDDHAEVLRSRAAAGANGGAALAGLIERRLIDGEGRRRWFRASRRVIERPDGRHYITVMQDVTDEHIERERAEGSRAELDEWFDFAPVGMLLFDDQGLVLRANAAFEALVGQPVISLVDAPRGVRELFGFGASGPEPGMFVPGASLKREAEVAVAGAPTRRLRASFRTYAPGLGRPRCMAVVEDCSAEDERELARIQIGAVMHTAGVGVATFRDSNWMHQRTGIGDSAPATLQNIGRDIVEAASLPAYEQLIAALKGGRRAEVRYAIRHPELGARWLLTRVEPATLASGQRTMSVVTLDITEQERARLRGEQLLGELVTILESTPAGIASLRGQRIVRCNARFEAMLGLESDASVVGRPLEELFDSGSRSRRVAAETLRTLAEGALHAQSEFELPAGADGRPQWYSLSVRRAGRGAEGFDAIAVLSDITRLKTQQRSLEAMVRDREAQAERTRAILDSALVGIVIVGADGIRWMNRSARRMFGGELDDFRGQPIETVADADPEHPFRRATSALATLADAQVETFECRVRARDGREYWVVGNAVATADDSGGRELTYALLDIERRRQAEARVSQAQASLQRLIEAAPMAITLRDARTLRVLQVNPMAAEALLSTPEQLVGRTPEEMLDPAQAAEQRADMEAALRSSDPTVREYRLRGRDGEPRLWDTRYLPIASDPDGEPDQLLQVAADVTEQRAAQEARFAAALAQREMLVKEVHHRIKNNLQGVAGLLQHIGERKPEMATTIAEVVGQVQAIAQVHGLQVGAAGTLRVKNVVEAITASLGRTFGRRIDCRVVGDAVHHWSLPESESIPVALALNELLTNAIKHGSGAVRCTLDCGTSGIRLEIANAGQLPASFDLEQFRGGVAGLGLVRALLPRRNASLAFEQRGDRVVATVALAAPAIAWIESS